ncbi:MAG: hypothetical protein ACQEVA_06610 [Myxococcota bacterium]
MLGSLWKLRSACSALLVLTYLFIGAPPSVAVAQEASGSEDEQQRGGSRGITTTPIDTSEESSDDATDDGEQPTRDEAAGDEADASNSPGDGEQAPPPAAQSQSVAATAEANLAAPPEGEDVYESQEWKPPRKPRFAEFGCPVEVRPASAYVVCVDTHHGRVIHTEIFPRGRRILPPNTPVIVRIYHSENYLVRVKNRGQLGTYVPGVDTSGFEPEEQGARGGGLARMIVTTHTVPPQLPGEAGIEIEVRDVESGDTADTYLVQYIVEKTYVGALRVGVGAVFSGARDGNYEIRTVPGSSQPEITATDPGFATMELVLGYAAFLESDGRPARGCRTQPICLAPYFGIGLLSTTPDEDLRFLSSLYLGLEIEPVRNFSIAVAGVGRRSTRLRNGFEVGSPVDSAASIDDVTTSAYTLGAAVTLSISPQFFKIAASESASTALPF